MPSPPVEAVDSVRHPGRSRFGAAGRHEPYNKGLSQAATVTTGISSSKEELKAAKWVYPLDKTAG